MKTLGKTIIIILVFMGSLFCLIEIKGENLSGKILHKMVFIEKGDDWQRCRLENCHLAPQTNSVNFVNFASRASITSYNLAPGFPFTRLILSWNCSLPNSNTFLDFAVEVSPDSLQWHRFDYITYGAVPDSVLRSSWVKEINGVGKIEADNLVLAMPMQYARVIVKAVGNEKSSEVSLRRLAISFSSRNSSSHDYANNHPPEAKPGCDKIKLAVPYFTQRNLPENMAGNCCSPTSVSMVLNYYGKDVGPEECAHRAYDFVNKIYGNWPYNVEAAYLGGMGKTWVDSHCSFDELYDEVAGGKPVVISIAYGFDELPHSPIHEAPDGHLIVVVGFDGPDRVICNDPAGHNIDDGIITYPRHELEELWIAHGGIAYHLWID